jgi:PAS domain S-box-containing protein
MTTPQVPPKPEVGPSDFAEHLDVLRARIEQLHDEEQQDERARPEIVADLETAYEELRVADEEVRTQQDHISRLLERHNLLHWQHERMLAMLPVPALVTDSGGMIRSVNAAAAALAGMRVARLLGRPIFTLFDPADRRELRQLLTAGTAPMQQRPATLVPPSGNPVRVEASVTSRPGEGSEVTWLLLTPDSPHSQGQLRALPGALTELAGLPAQGSSTQEVLNRAADICRSSLDRPEVSISLGPPDQPDVVCSTSQLAQALDGAQVAAGEGPSLTAFAVRTPVTSPDLHADGRWQGLSRLLPAGHLSAVAVPVEVGQRRVGTLSVYGDSGPLEAWVEDAAELLAATLGAVFYELELNGELEKLGADMQRALASRATIEQAKGIVMAQTGCGPDEAFAHLTALSSRDQRKLRDVAGDIVGRASGVG